MPPVYTPTNTNHYSSSSYASDGTTELHYLVSSYACTYRDDLALQGAGIIDGTYLDGEIAHAYRPDYRVIYSNGGGESAMGGTGDWARVVANTCSTADYLGF